MDMGNVLNWGLAVWGAGLSTVLGVQQVRDRAPHLRVSLAFVAGMRTDSAMPGLPAKMNYFTAPLTDPNVRFLALNAANVGARRVTLLTVGLQPPKKDFFLLPQSPSSAPFPRRLEPGESCIDVWPAAEIARSLRAEGFNGEVELRGLYIDGVRHQHRAKPLTFDIDAWAQRQ